MCKDCQCSNIKCNGALVANLDSFVRERKIDVSVFARIRNFLYDTLHTHCVVTVDGHVTVCRDEWRRDSERLCDSEYYFRYTLH